jgi:hypothetical protein
VQPSATPAPPTKKKRTIKNLPDGLAKLTEKTFRTTLSFKTETDSSESGDVMVAYQATVMNEHDICEVFELDKLNLEQLRRFSRNVGVPYVNKCTKFQCRKGLWILGNHQEQLEKYGGHDTTAEERVSSNVIRLCNVIFGHDFLDDLLALNDGKNRVDHETGGMANDFWAGVTEALNCASDDDATASTVILAEEDPHYEELMELD